MSLPPTCSLPPTGDTTIDIGQCSGDKCRLRSPDLFTVNTRCCGQVATEWIIVECEGFVYRTRKITSCGCVECPESDEINIDGEVYVKGSAEIVEYLLLEVDGFQGITSRRVSDGKFRIKGIPTDNVVTIRYEPRIVEQYLATVVVIHIVQGVQQYHVAVQLTSKPEPVVLNPKHGASIDVGNSPNTSSALQIHIPPDAVVDGYGNPVKGDVNVFVSFFDPRVEDGLLGAPGEFTYEDAEGETMHLQTFGVVGLHLETTYGQKAYINGQVNFDIDVSSFDIPEVPDSDHGEPTISLWTLNSVSGNWKESGPLQLTGTSREKRTKRQTGNVASASSSFPPYLPYINIDKPLFRGRTCHVSVFVFNNEKMTEVISGEEVRIYTKGLSGNRYLGPKCPNDKFRWKSLSSPGVWTETRIGHASSF